MDLYIRCAAKIDGADKTILVFLIKATAARNKISLSYHGVCGLYFLAVVFTATIVMKEQEPAVTFTVTYTKTSRAENLDMS